MLWVIEQNCLTKAWVKNCSVNILTDLMIPNLLAVVKFYMFFIFEGFILGSTFASYRHKLVVFHFDDIADNDLVPFFFH